MVRKKAAKKSTRAKKAKVEKLTPEEEAGISEIAKRISSMKKQKASVKEEKQTSSITFTMQDVDDFLKSHKKKTARKTKKKKKNDSANQKIIQSQPEAPKKVKKVSAASLNDILGIGAAPVIGSRKVKNEGSVPQKFKKYYELLIDLRNHLSDDLALHTQETLNTSGKEDSGDLSGYGQHTADAGSEAFDRDLALNMVSSEQDALKEVEAAIDRIFEGSYGVCEQTGQAINHDRLMAVPFTRFSLMGQQDFEKNSKRKREEDGQVFEDSGDDIPLFTELDPDA